jgi:hypothetical protein
MNTHNETISYLTLQGWEFDPNSSDEASFYPKFDHELLKKERYSMSEALEIENKIDPESYREFELVTNLDTKYVKMFVNYMDS